MGVLSTSDFENSKC